MIAPRHAAVTLYLQGPPVWLYGYKVNLLGSEEAPKASASTKRRSRDSGFTGYAYDLACRHGLDVDATGRRLVIGSTTGGVWRFRRARRAVAQAGAEVRDADTVAAEAVTSASSFPLEQP
jgi:hypothetical protein